MFERYTEKARRVIFFARYEASQFGTPAIEPEHFLLGLLKEDPSLVMRFFTRPSGSIEAIRREVEGRTLTREKISTSVELPLAPETKRVLAYVHEESDRLQHRHIGTEHLLLGLLREERSLAAEILKERGVRYRAAQEEIARLAGAAASDHPTEATENPEEAARLWQQAMRLTQENLAATLGDEEAAAGMERQANLYVIMLREAVTKLGGLLEITARFPEGTIRVEKRPADKEIKTLNCKGETRGKSKKMIR